MNRFTLSLFLCSVSCMVVSCGGSGSGESVGSRYSLYPQGFFSFGFNESYNVSGSDTRGQTYSGRYSLQTQVEAPYNGAPATAVVQTLDFTNSQSGSSSSSVGTEYYTVSQGSVKLVGFSTAEVTTVSANPGTIPAEAAIGDFGAVGSYVDNAGNTRVSSWRLESAESGNARLVSLLTTTDQAGEVVDTSETSQVIDTAGNRLSVELRINNIRTGLAVTLNGVKNE